MSRYSFTSFVSAIFKTFLYVQSNNISYLHSVFKICRYEKLDRNSPICFKESLKKS